MYSLKGLIKPSWSVTHSVAEWSKTLGQTVVSFTKGGAGLDPAGELVFFIKFLIRIDWLA